MDNPWVSSFVFYGCSGFFALCYYNTQENKTLKPWDENQQEAKVNLYAFGVITSKQR